MLLYIIKDVPANVYVVVVNAVDVVGIIGVILWQSAKVYRTERLTIETEFVGSNPSGYSVGFLLLLPSSSPFSSQWFYSVSGVSYVVPL